MNLVMNDTNISSDLLTVRFVAHRRAAFDKKFRALNRKASKLGLPPTTIVTDTTEWVDVRVPNSDPVKYIKVEVAVLTLKAHRVEISGGWRVIGSIEPLPGTSLRIVNVMNKAADVKQFENHDMHCDHCNTLRPRNKVVIVKAADGSLKTVGSTCLKSFTGIDPAAALHTEDVKSLNDDDMDAEGAFGSRSYGLPAKSVVEAALAVIRVEKGYFKASNEDYGYSNAPTPTFMTVYSKLDHFYGCGNECSKLIETYKTLDEDTEKAEAILAQWKSIDLNTESNDFTRKLAIIAQADVVPHKLVSTICGGVSFWLKANNKPKTDKLPSDFIGNKPGDKMTATVTVERINSYMGQFGTVLIINMLANGKDKIVWFASGDCSKLVNDYGEPVPGEHKVKFTIKGHKDDPKWGKQTTVTRLKVL
jgi:hypothetical protein